MKCVICNHKFSDDEYFQEHFVKDGNVYFFAAISNCFKEKQTHNIRFEESSRNFTAVIVYMKQLGFEKKPVCLKCLHDIFKHRAEQVYKP